VRSDVNIFIKRDKCYVCGICIERCIMDNLRMYLAPCRQACPIHMNCQGYVRLIAQGKEEEAAKEMRKDLPFSGIIGRVCHHPCEEKCERRKEDNQPVHIRALKRYLADSRPDIGFEPGPLAKETGKRVAIVGSGPAGLMAAHELAAKGHAVTVFDSAPEPGGMLRFGIPAFRLPGEETAKAVRMLERMKVVFQTGRTLGRELDIEKLEREWDGLLLAAGGGPALRLGIAGEDLPRVFQGLDLLRQVREGQNPKIGKSVLVIGGGNTAVDAALTCRKLGAEEVSLVCLEERGKMPAFPAEVEEALEEGVRIQDCWGPRRVIRNSNGALTVDLSRCLSVFDEQGRFCPALEDTCSHSPSAETIIVAIGQKPEWAALPKEIQGAGQSGPIVDSLTLQTGRPKIFAAGDLVSGPKSVIEAMAQGREAAVSIDRFLSGETLRWGRAYWDGTSITEFPIDRSGAVARPRAVLPRLPMGRRDLRMEVEKPLDSKAAREEAERCLNCGRPGEFNQTCWYCLPCEIECPVEALEVRIPYLVR
jgi:NADPH-dependent glutamate synthase beta subunit-like oxidoreductase